MCINFRIPFNDSWHNTNKLLKKGFAGIKTGITETAGPCLATYMRAPKQTIVIIVLQCQTMDHRWTEVKQLMQWGYKA